MVALPSGEQTRNTKRRRPRFVSSRVMWWPLLLVPLLIWAAYAIGTPWPDSAPIGVRLEMYGEPLDIQDMQTVLRENGRELTVQSTELVRRSHSGRSIGLHEDSFVRAKVEFDGVDASIIVYPDAPSVERDWVDWDGALQPRDSYVSDVIFTRVENTVIVESGWLNPTAGLGKALQDLHR